jgi:hypothetical protein
MLGLPPRSRGTFIIRTIRGEIRVFDNHVFERAIEVISWRSGVIVTLNWSIKMQSSRHKIHPSISSNNLCTPWCVLCISPFPGIQASPIQMILKDPNRSISLTSIRCPLKRYRALHPEPRKAAKLHITPRQQIPEGGHPRGLIHKDESTLS